MIAQKKHSAVRGIVGPLTRAIHQLVIAVILLPALTQPAHAQGCSQCRDNLNATPPETQSAYRHAIYLLLVAGGGVFIGTVLLLKKYRS